jgi:hypothetical protein
VHRGFPVPIVALAQQPDGKLIVSGYRYDPEADFSVSYLGRLNPDGTLDWLANVDTIGVSALALMADGKVLVGG